MKLKLDKKNRKYIEIEVENEDSTAILKYYEKNTKQIKQLREAIKKDNKNIDDLNESQFLQNLKGNKEVIKELIDFYEENGNFYEFMNECDVELGKLKRTFSI